MGRQFVAMKPGLRKSLLTIHIIVSVGWLGAVAGFLALAITGLTNLDHQILVAAYYAMNVIARLVIVPLAFASLLTGILQALGTPWGLFRHYWIVTKLGLTVFSTAILIAKMPLIRRLSEAAISGNLVAENLQQGRVELLVHAGGGLVLLIAITVISVFKPWGRIARQREGIRSTTTE